MAVEVTIKVDGLEDLKKLPQDTRTGILNGFRRGMIFLEGMAKKDFMKPRSAAGGLHVRTGRLRRSIQGVVTSKTEIRGYLGTDVIYAPSHEYGATIVPKNKPLLRFQLPSGQWVSKKKVVIPKRPFIEPAVTENLDKFIDLMETEIVREVDK